MKNMYFRRIGQLYDDGGLSEVARGVRDFVHHLSIYPLFFVDDLAGVRVGSGPGLLPRHSRINYPFYKRGLLDSVCALVGPGDNVTIVGSRGVDAVFALRAGAGSVTVYEGGKTMVRICKETINLNVRPALADRAEVQHAIIGDPITVYGPTDGVTTIDPSNLHGSDVLVLDCEGAELSIIEGLSCDRRFPVVICEAHPGRGVPVALVEDLLEQRGYTTTQVEFEPYNDDPDKEVVVGR